MALLQTFNLEHLPSSHTLHIALFQHVKNAPFIHQQLLSNNTEFEYAFIDADIVSQLLLQTPDNHVLTQAQILSKVHALAAAYRAVNDLLESRLKSCNVHSQVVCSLSPKNNVGVMLHRS